MLCNISEFYQISTQNLHKFQSSLTEILDKMGKLYPETEALLWNYPNGIILCTLHCIG
jgi:hypothetical protein